jgi:hypothetical protein
MQMGRLYRLPRRGQSPLHAVEEAIAAFHEELEFSMNYAHAMVRDENYRAAAEVIEEQRRSLVRTSQTIERALARPEIERRRMRLRAAVSGLAAALLIGSGAFAAFGPGAQPPVRDTKIQAVDLASESLSRADVISDPQALQELFGGAQETVLEAAHAAQAAPADPTLKQSLLNFVRTQDNVLRRNPHIPDQIRERAADVAKTVEEIVTDEPVVELIIPEEAPEDDAAGGEAAE